MVLSDGAFAPVRGETGTLARVILGVSILIRVPVEAPVVVLRSVVPVVPLLTVVVP